MTTLQRQSALERQGGLCFYCQFPLWEAKETDLASFAGLYNFTTRQARRFLSTAEHLLPRSDGGPDSSSNIVAACVYCNSKRHQRRRVPSPDAYCVLVRRRVERGKWHPDWAHEATPSNGMRG